VGVERLGVRQRLQKLGLGFFPLATQVYPRKQDYQVTSALAGLGATLYKFAFDLRFLQSPPVGEWSEPFGEQQVGSSAMPFKRNPINAEKIDSLARLLAQFPRLAWDNAAHSLLERTLDDSANRRVMLPEAFLIADELLSLTGRLISGLHVNEAALKKNLALYAPFAASERVLMALAKGGADRQVMHARLRQHALHAWSAIQAEQPNPLLEELIQDQEIARYLTADELLPLFDVTGHVGDAPERARALAAQIRLDLA
jgi:adenylosuccinate lyase